MITERVGEAVVAGCALRRDTRRRDGSGSWIAGFAWALPRAMAAAVSACRFEQGDVLCRERAACGRWGPEDVPSGPVLQVLDPPKSARTLAADAEGSRFEAHWDSPVTLERHEAGVGRPERIETTQGRLYTCLWRDAPGCFDEAAPPPSPPRGLRDLHRELATAVPAFRQCFARRTKRGDHQLLIVATDDAIDVARVKARAIESLLGDAFEIEACNLSPAEAGLSDSETLRPSLLLRGIAIATRDQEAIEKCLAGLLYGGASEDAKRFSVSRHGHLGPLSVDASPTG
jgi:hypothetical protein